MQNTTPFLWFEKNAKEAVGFYTSVFRDSRIIGDQQLENVPGPEGNVYTITFEVKGLRLMALNGGPTDNGEFDSSFTGGISLMVSCDSQEETDEYWEKLSEGGKPGPCGWITDKYGVVWQITPKLLEKLMGDPDREKAGRVAQAMMKMGKIECDVLQQAYDGK
jgi:predicted 3-demethylubiquinone-9 3-methyltransferase (glyoxalase superfamily)